MMTTATPRPRIGKIGREVRRQLKALNLTGFGLVSAALAEATADLADIALKEGRTRDFLTLSKDLERLLVEVRRGDDARADDAGEAGGVEPEPVQSRGLAAVLGTGAALGNRKVS